MTTYARSAWTTAPPGGNPLAGQCPRIFIHHTVGITPSSVEQALAEVARIREQHVQFNGWVDIGYSWLVDDAGNCFEGRGWLRSGAHTEGYNSVSHAICWMGNSMNRRPSTSAIAAIAQCILDGQRVGAVGMSPTIEGHRDVNATACPGDALYDALSLIRLAVLGGDLGGATITPSAEEDDMTPEQEAKLDRVLNVAEQIATGQLTGAVVRELDPRLNGLAARIDAIRGVATDLTVVPTAVLVAELGRRAGASQ